MDLRPAHARPTRAPGFAALTAAALLALTPGAAAASPAVAAPAAVPHVFGSAAEADCLDAPVAALRGTGIGGVARLCASADGVTADFSSERLSPGSAYTLWFVYFDSPSTCATTPCSGADALGDDPPAVFSRMDGIVAKPSGAAHFAGEIRDLRLSPGSEIWLLMFSHGPASEQDNRARARQLLTPQSPTLGAPAAGAAADGEIGTGAARAVFDIPA